MHTVKTLIRLCECAVWSESSLSVHVRRYISAVSAHIETSDPCPSKLSDFICPINYYKSFSFVSGQQYLPMSINAKFQILTARLYRQTSDLFCNKSLAGSARRDLAPFRRHFDTFLTSVFVATILDGLTLFLSHQQRKKCMEIWQL